MATKIGPRGITIQDVMGVAQNGAQNNKTQYVYAPNPTPPPTATTPFDYAALLAGQPAATYGQKYGGMPTAEYAKSLIVGAALQAQNVGQLAAMQANINQQDLLQKQVTDLRSGTNRLSPTFETRFNQPLLPEDQQTNNFGSTPLGQSAETLANQERKLASMYFYDQNGEQQLQMGTYRPKAEALQTAVSEGKQALTRTGYDPGTPNRYQEEAIRQTAVNKQNAYGTYMDKMNMLKASKLIPQPDSLPLYPSVPSMVRNAAERQTQIDLQPSWDAAYAQQVAPYQNVAEGIGKLSLSQLAQQMAVQRYGYDPALAAGIFDQGVDIQALTDEQTLYGLQNPELSLSPEEMVFQQYGQEGLDQYIQQQAQSSLYGTPTEQTALAQQEYTELDTNLFGLYASTPAEVLKENPDVARQYMSDETFLAEFQSGVTQIAGAGQGLQQTAASEFLLKYANGIDDPVRARIMENLIDSTVSFMGG